MIQSTENTARTIKLTQMTDSKNVCTITKIIAKLIVIHKQITARERQKLETLHWHIMISDINH